MSTNQVFGRAMKLWLRRADRLVLFLNVTAGISIISQASPMAQEITGVNAVVAATMVGIISIANGAGRFIWSWLSECPVSKAHHKIGLSF